MLAEAADALPVTHAPFAGWRGLPAAAFLVCQRGQRLRSPVRHDLRAGGWQAVGRWGMLTVFAVPDANRGRATQGAVSSQLAGRGIPTGMHWRIARHATCVLRSTYCSARKDALPMRGHSVHVRVRAHKLPPAHTPLQGV